MSRLLFRSSELPLSITSIGLLFLLSLSISALFAWRLTRLLTRELQVFRGGGSAVVLDESSSTASEMFRDLSQPINVTVLDATTAAFYGSGSGEVMTAAHQVLLELQENPDMLLQVVHILEKAKNVDTKFFCLQVLEGFVKCRWNALPLEQRDAIKNYIFQVIVLRSSNEPSFQEERLYINKLIIVLIQILKREWPARWPSFVPDLVAAAKANEIICQNCMAILKLLSEEVFEFSRGEMTQQKIEELKQSLHSEFQLIHELFVHVLSASQSSELTRATLSTLHAFLSWIPLRYIFDSSLLDRLLGLFFLPSYRILSLHCLTEVAARNFENLYDVNGVKMYTTLMRNLQIILPPTTNIPEAYAHRNSDDCAFIKNLALFFSSFFKVHIRVLESTKENKRALLTGVEYLINISYVDDAEVFEVCLDYWNSLVSEIFNALHNVDNRTVVVNITELSNPRSLNVVDEIEAQLLLRLQLYDDTMSRLRMLMIHRMAKPDEVLIVEDENGNIVRETMEDNTVSAQYVIMRETLILLSHLNCKDTEQLMRGMLHEQFTNESQTWNNLNELCWAIGSISGSMMEEQEKNFLLTVIPMLFKLSGRVKGKDIEYVIASNIMYVVGQHPRFLRAHWKFLKIFLDYLFDFMGRNQGEVQDMALDRFLNIVQKCKSEFVILQEGENEPYVSELLSCLAKTVAHLEPHQICTFYESVGHMIQAESDAQKREEYLRTLMHFQNQEWFKIIAQGRKSGDFLKNQDVMKTLHNILQTNISVASSLGTYFLPQFSVISSDMLNLYKVFSKIISSSIAEGGPSASKTSYVKLLRSVKRKTLKLIETFLDKTEDQPQILQKFVSRMMDTVLDDYAGNVPDARESEVLSLFATIINKYKSAMMEDLPHIFEAIFQCTPEMMTKNFEDNPAHRLKFFYLLCTITTHCFPAFLRLSSQKLKLVIDSIIWAVRHTESNIAETGLNLLLEMLKNFEDSEFRNQFYQTYFVTIEQETFAVLTDTLHKQGFKLHIRVLQHLFVLVGSDLLKDPFWDAASIPHSYLNNAIFVLKYTIKLVETSFPNITPEEVTRFVQGLFASRNDLAMFKNHVHDFLVQSNEFSAQTANVPMADMEPPENVLFICQLNPQTNETCLIEKFSRFGLIVFCKMGRDRDTKASLCHAFIGFQNRECCEKALQMDGKYIDGSKLRVRRITDCPVLWSQHMITFTGSQPQPQTGLIGLLDHDKEITQELHNNWFLAENSVDNVLSVIKLSEDEITKRQGIVEWLSELTKIVGHAQLYYVGSGAFGACLQGGDIDLTLTDKDHRKKDWPDEILKLLKCHENNPESTRSVSETQYVFRGHVPIIKFRVDGISIDLSFDRHDGIRAVAFLKEANQIMGKNDLFMKAVILTKAWAYEAKLSGGKRNLISSYCLTVMVLYILAVFESNFFGPLEVLYRFVHFYKNFDWENFILVLKGPESILHKCQLMPKVDKYCKLAAELHDCMLDNGYLDQSSNSDRLLVSMNVIDPVDTNENLGRKTKKGDIRTIREAFSLWAERLSDLNSFIELDKKEEAIDEIIKQLFRESLQLRRS